MHRRSRRPSLGSFAVIAPLLLLPPTFAACAAGGKGDPMPPRPSSITTSPPPSNDGGPGTASAANAASADAGPTHRPRGMDEWYAFDAKVTAAFDALSAKGLMPEVITQFRNLAKLTPAKTRPTNATSLEGALSDDGQGLVVKTLGSGQIYFADPKTGILRGRRSARWHEGPPRFLSGTHFVPVSEERPIGMTDDKAPAAGPALRREPFLAIYDAVTGARELEATGPTAFVCASAAGSITAWASREGSSVTKTHRVHVWDAKTKMEVDAFDAPAQPQWDGCVRVLPPAGAAKSASFVTIAWAGNSAVPRGFLLRDIMKKQTLATIMGGAYGPELGVSPDGKLLAIGQRPDQRGGPPGQTLLLDIATGKTLATSAECPSPGSLVFDAKGGVLAAGDQRDVCLFSVPSLKLIRKTAPMRDPFPPGAVTQVIRELRFFAQSSKDPMLLGATEDGKAVVYKVSNGTVLWKGERGGFMVDVDAAGKEGVAHFLIRKGDDGPFVHVTLGQDAKLKEEAPQESEMKQLYEKRWQSEKSEALRSALLRVATASCELGGVLVPKEACEPTPAFP